MMKVVKREKNVLRVFQVKKEKKLIRKKLELQGLTEGSGVREEDQSSYDKEEMIDLILLTRCFQKNKFQ